MAFVKRDVKDRVVQYPRRYRLVPVTGQEDTYDLSPVTGTVTEPGTPVNKAYLQPIEDAISDIESGAMTVGKAANADKIGNIALSGLAESKSSGTTDLNTIIKSGMYRADVAANSPPGCSYGQLLVMHGANDTITQIYGNYANGALYTRSGNPSNVGGTGSWSAWKQILTTSELPINHASTGTGYGVGNASNYGHLKTRNDLIGTETEGAALTPAMGKALNDKILTNKPVLLATVPLNTSATDIQNYLNNGGNPYDAYILQLEGSITITNSDTSSERYCTIGLYDSASATIERIRLGGSNVKKSSSRTVSYSLQYIFNISFPYSNVDSNGDYLDTFRYYSLDNTTYYIQAILNGTISTSSGARYFKIVPMNSKFTFSNNSMVLKIYGVNYNILS